MSAGLVVISDRSWLAGGAGVALSDGTVRSRGLAETRSLLEPLLASNGITRVADLTGLDVIDVPVYSAIRPGAATLAASSGKGLCHDSAWISAVMESLEVGAAEKFVPEITLRASARDAGVPYSVHDLDLHPYSLVDDTTILDWLPATDLVSGSDVLVPAAAVGLRGWTAERWSPPLFTTTSNGLAAGNDPAEAAVHGLFELIERDALSKAGPEQRSLVASAGFGARVADLLERVRAVGGEVEVERMNGLAGTSTFLCYLWQPEMPQLFGGSGCHVDAAIAVERALLEAAQSRTAVVSGLRDDIGMECYRGPSKAARLRRRVPTAEMPAGSSRSFGSMADLLEFLAGRIFERTARPVIAVNLTPPGQTFPAVVQVLAPGLKPSPEAPGRPREDGPSRT